MSDEKQIIEQAEREQAKKPPALMLYEDMSPMFYNLSNEQAGKLIKGLFEYFESGILLVSDDAMVKTFFEIIKKRIIVDQKKYSKRCEQNKKNAEQRYKNKSRDLFEELNECE